ncbi:serine--tRNA ligase, partial [candidate division KSB1 bacterium 4572_119]
MLDMKFIRNNVDKVKAAIEQKNDIAEVDKLIELDADKRKILFEVEELKHKRNKVSEEIAKLKKQKLDASKIITEMKEVSDKIKSFDEQVKALDEQINQILIQIPNIPHETVPIGKDESANVEIKKWGDLPEIDFKPQTHWEIGEKLGILDLAGG